MARRWCCQRSRTSGRSLAWTYAVPSFCLTGCCCAINSSMVGLLFLFSRRMGPPLSTVATEIGSLRTPRY